MSTPVAPAPAAPAPVADAAPAAPKTLTEIQREQRNLRAAPVKGPTGSGTFVKLNGKPLPTPAAKAGAPAPTPPRAENGQFQSANPPAPVADAPRGEGAQSALDAKREVTESVLPSRHKVKVDGQEREVSTEELVQNYQIRQHLDKKLQAIAELTNLGKKDFNALVHKLAEDFGQDPQKVAESILMKRAEKWQEEQLLKDMTPEQREYYELKRDKAQRDAQTKADADAKAKADSEAAANASKQATYEKTTNILIEAHKLMPEGIKNHPEFNSRSFARVKDRLLALASQVPGTTPIDEFLATVDPKALMLGALDDHRSELRLALETADESEIERLIPDSVRERIIARSRAAIAGRHPQLQARPQVGRPAAATEPVKKEEPKPLSAFKPTMAQMLNRGRR